MSLPPGLGFSFPLNHSRCAGEGLANCLFSQVAPGDGCPAARCAAHAGHSSRRHSQVFPQPEHLLCQTNEHSAAAWGHRALHYISPRELKKQSGGHLKREGRMGRGLPARRGDAGNPLVCAPDHYGAGMANKSKGKWGRTPSVVGSLPGGLHPPPKVLCWAGQ